MFVDSLRMLGNFGYGALILVLYPGLPFAAGTVAIVHRFLRAGRKPRASDFFVLPFLNGLLAVATQFLAVLPFVLLQIDSGWWLVVALALAGLVQYLVADRLMHYLFGDGGTGAD